MAHPRGPCWRTSPPRRDTEAQAGEEGHPLEESAHGPRERQGRQAGYPEREQAREDPRTAEATRGASAKELLKATGWQPHSLRGFLSGTVGKKMGLALTSTKGEDGGRVYSLKV